MCETCNTLTTLQVDNYDPTRTTTLRAAFVSNFKRRFNNVIKVVKESIVDNDCFALNSNISINQLTAAGRSQFDFPTLEGKVNSFMRWFNAQVDAGIFEVGTLNQLGTSFNDLWLNRYIFDSYKRGVQRARWEMKKVGMNVPTDGVDIAMGTPLHLETLGVLYSRNFQLLKGITNAMDTQISIVLTQGLADGINPNVLARKLVAVINGKGADKSGIKDSLGRFVPAQRRAQTLARTEIIRAHHKATINEYMNWRAGGVYVKAEFMTAGDDRVCSQCLALEGTIHTLETAMNLVPVHANCRCICLPFQSNTK